MVGKFEENCKENEASQDEVCRWEMVVGDWSSQTVGVELKEAKPRPCLARFEPRRPVIHQHFSVVIFFIFM